MAGLAAGTKAEDAEGAAGVAEGVAVSSAITVRWDESSSSLALSADNFVVGTFLQMGWEAIMWGERENTIVFIP